MYKLLLSTFIYSISFLINHNTIKNTELTYSSKLDPCYIEYLYSVPLLEYQDYLSKAKEKELEAFKKAKEANNEKDNDFKVKNQARTSKKKSSFSFNRNVPEESSDSAQSNIVSIRDNKEGEDHDKEDSKKAEQLTDTKSQFFLKELVSTKKVKAVLLEAVSELKSIAYGKVQITSGFRNWGGKKHRIGQAIDISYDEDFIYFLLSDKGKEWLNTHNLEFFIEDKRRSTKNTLPEEFLPHWRYISHATNLHIHLCLK